MAQIPLDSFRILTKKFGWEKSFDEIVNDDINDVSLIRESIKSSQETFLNPETDELGEWDGSAQNIAKIWLQYFMLQMRFNVKTTYLVTGVQKRGIPKTAAEEHIVQVGNFRNSLDELFLTSTYVHLMFLFLHLYDQESHRGKQEFFDLIFESQYLTCINTAHEIALEHPMFSKKTVDLGSIERKLRAQWMGDFKKLWSSQNSNK